MLAVLGGWQSFQNLLIHAFWLLDELDYGHQEQGGYQGVQGGIIISHENLMKVCDDFSHEVSVQYHSFKNHNYGDLSKNLL